MSSVLKPSKAFLSVLRGGNIIIKKWHYSYYILIISFNFFIDIKLASCYEVYNIKNITLGKKTLFNYNVATPNLIKRSCRSCRSCPGPRSFLRSSKDWDLTKIFYENLLWRYSRDLKKILGRNSSKIFQRKLM